MTTEAATLAIPLYLVIGSGSGTEIGSVTVAVRADGTAELTITDIAAALRETADEMEQSAEEVSDAPARQRR